MTSTIHPFTIAVEQADIDNLRRKLALTRWPDQETCDGWNQGIPLNYCREMADYWATEYDWRRAEAMLNSWPQYMVDIELDGQSHAIHVIHRRSSNPDAMPLLLSHGWPGSVMEFHKVIDALAEPQEHGGAGTDAFHVIVPSLPGYGFSGKATGTGMSVERIADIFDATMGALGYDRYYAQGGDWGSMITSSIGLRHPERCAGIHLNMILAAPDPDTLAAPNADEQAAFAALEHYKNWDSGYSTQQSSRPQTLAYGLADSPVGQMAWIVEKFWAWTDCERDGIRHPENALTRDEMLDDVSIYWFNNCAASSARLYWESFGKPNLDPVDVPMGGSQFPKEILRTSERWARKRFPQMVYWNSPEKGGHFAALEQPELFIAELRACFSKMH